MAKKITVNYKIDCKTELLILSRPWITIKDHKENFHIDTKVRLICPNKYDFCKLSKIVLDEKKDQTTIMVKHSEYY